MLSRKKTKKTKKKGSVAGLSLHEDSLRYIELQSSGGGFNVVRQEFIPLSPGCISRESIQQQQFNVLEKAFEDLKRQLGKMSCPVTLGVPARDVILRLIDYPRTTLEDIEDALTLEFEGYFPYPRAEAAASIAEVEVPQTSQEAEAKTTVLVATSRLSLINDLLRVVGRADIPLNAIEPMNVAFFRASVGQQLHSDAYLMVGVETEVTNIILGYRDNGILFRTTLVDLKNAANLESDAALMPILQDVQNTMVFAGNQYRGLVIRDLILGGSLGASSPRLKMILEAGASLNVTLSDIWSSWQINTDFGNIPGYEAAVGLALRDMI